MVMCRISESGYIDFTAFAQHVADARAMAKSQPPPQATAQRASSSSTPVQPLRPGDAHRMMRDAERQATVVRLKEKEIRLLFEAFDDGKMSTQEFKGKLQMLGLTITTDAESLLRRSEACETSFSALLRSLCVQDHGGPPLDGTFVSTGDSGVAVNAKAGGRNRRAGEFGARKRTDPRRAHSVLSATAGGGVRENIGERGTGSRKGKFFTSSEGVRGTLDQGGGKTLMSTARMSMQAGIGEEFACSSGVGGGINCEQKMLRQQIFSLVRKMDGGEITARDFQDKLFTMGFEIPGPVLQLLKNYDSSGKADFKQFVRAFEKYFDSRSTESSASTEKLAGIKDSIKSSLAVKGASSVAQLANVFKNMDDDGSGQLSLSEFKKGCKEYGIDMKENDLRLLFNSFDRDGNGQLSYHEFLVAIRGPIPSTRLQLVRQAFRVLDKTGTNSINTDDVRHVYDPSSHPDVIDGKISEDEALRQFLDAFDSGDKDGLVSFEEFLEYYTNLSASIENDYEFGSMLRTAWNLDDMPPPPPSYKRNKDGTITTKPLAGQNHGDILNWNQKPSALEAREARAHRLEKSHASGMATIDAHKSTSINVMAWTTGHDAQRALEEEQSNSFGSKSKQNVNRKALDQTANILSWEKHQKSKEPEKKKVVEAEVVWMPGHKKKGGANMHHGRPSPFGVDEEPTAYKVMKAKADGTTAIASKPKVRSLAELGL